MFGQAIVGGLGRGNDPLAYEESVSPVHMHRHLVLNRQQSVRA